MSAFSTWLISFVRNAITWFYNLFIDLIQHVSDGLATFCIFVVSLFPSGSSLPALPPAPTGGAFTAFLSTLNWIFPISFMVSMAAWLALGMLAYVFIAPLARWAKLLT